MGKKVFILRRGSAYLVVTQNARCVGRHEIETEPCCVRITFTYIYLFSLIVQTALWGHQIDFHVTGTLGGIRRSRVNSPQKRPVRRSFDDSFYLRPNKRLRKQTRRWWFESPSCSLWRHWNAEDHKDMKQISTPENPVSHVPFFHVFHIARRHGPVIWMALHSEGDWWMDT